MITANKALHLTAIPLCYIAAGKLCRYAEMIDWDFNECYSCSKDSLKSV